MGQKVNPIVFRIGVNETWRSNWFGDRKYKQYLYGDYKIRALLYKHFKNAAIDQILIMRASDTTRIKIFSAKSGFLIGKKGVEIEKIKKMLESFVDTPLMIDVVEVKKADLSAKINADSIAMQLEKRISFRRAMRRAVSNALKGGAKGIKVSCSGRLGGAEIARSEGYSEGRLRLHTLRSKVSYALSVAHTTYGTIGVKVWIYTGERFTYQTML